MEHTGISVSQALQPHTCTHLKLATGVSATDARWWATSIFPRVTCCFIFTLMAVYLTFYTFCSYKAHKIPKT